MSKTTSIQDLPGPAASSAPQPAVSVSASAPASSAAATAPSVPTAATSFPPQQPPAPGQNVVMTVTPISQAPASAPTQHAPQAPPQQAPTTSYQPTVPATTPQEQQQQDQHQEQMRMNAFMAGIQGAPSQPPHFPALQPAQRPPQGGPSPASASSPAPSGADGSVATLRERKQAADARNGAISLQHVLLVAVAIMFSHTPIVSKVLYRSAPSMFSSRGTYNISGLLITSIGFSLLYYGGVQLMHFLAEE